MATATLGISAKNLPTQQAITISGASFNIGGILAETERRYLVPFPIRNMAEYGAIFGKHDDPLRYGPDAIQGFFQNAGGSATMWVQSLVGYDIGGDVVDAVVASREKADVGADVDAYVFQAAYQGNLQYGAPGNRIGTKVTQADRFATVAAAICPATGQNYAELDSISGISEGDLILFKTNAGADPVYKKITQVEQTTGRVYWVGDFEVSGASGEALAEDDVVVIPGFRIQTYYKSSAGVLSEVDVELGKVVCSSEVEVVDAYVGNVHETNTHIKVSEQSTSLLGNRIPANDTDIVYLENGADGTDVETVEAQAYHLSKFDTLPVRFLTNPETININMQKALYTYALNRQDNPIVIGNIQPERTKTQLIDIGHNFQRSDFVPLVICANWLKVQDPFATSPRAPDREIPNVGHVTGAWVRTIQNLGIHEIPASDRTILNGVSGVVGEFYLDNNDRTDIAAAGINLIQNIQGKGIKIANLFTVSTGKVEKNANGILMRNYVKASAKAALESEENTPNTLARIEANGRAVFVFMFGHEVARAM